MEDGKHNPLSPHDMDPDFGLTTAEVRARTQAGQVNTQPPLITKTNAQIIREHACTFFNAINLIVFVALLLVGSYQNTMFMGVVLSNLLIGVVQEIRSKRAVEKLSLLNAPHANVVREGETLRIPSEEIVLGDVLLLELGSQIPTDCVLLTGMIEADESLLTGESKPIRKQSGCSMLSGSVVVSGSCKALVTQVGAQSYAAKLTLEAKKPKKTDSKLMRSLRIIIRFTGGIVLPLGIGLFARSYLQLGTVLKEAVEQTAASMIGMIPSGLMLLTSVSLTVGVLVLARKNVLVQENYCIETLARVDMLCLDKTGTLTTGKLRVHQVLPLFGTEEEAVSGMLHDFTGAIPAGNATATALHARFAPEEARSPLGITPFSSARRYSAASFASGGTVYLGAADAVCPGAPEQLLRDVDTYSKEGYRVLVLAHAAQAGAEPPLPADVHPAAMAILLLQDEIRPEAAKTLRFFEKEDVQIRIISGDDPRTVSHIAKRLALRGYDRYVDVSQLADDAAVCEAATTYHVFGRVSPHQKRLIIQALQAAGHTVAMTGDGVNDLLAIRAADCSIALYNGSDAARQASHMVLLTNDFSVLPDAVMEGRRVINNITRTASLFLVKTIFSFLLTISGVVAGLPYPFQPNQLTLISACTVGLPSTILSLEPNRSRVKGSFLKNVMVNAIPGALCVFIYSIITTIISPYLGFGMEERNTLCVYLAGTAGLMVLLKVCLPFGRRRGLLWFGMVALFFTAATVFHDWFGLAWMRGGRMLLTYAILAAGAYPMLAGLSRLLKKLLRVDGGAGASKLIDMMEKTAGEKE